MIALGNYGLRKPELRDAESIFRNYTQDPDVTKYLIWKPHENLGQTVDWIKHCINVFDISSHIKYVIVVLETDEAIGMIDATIKGHAAVIGYVLSKKYWGKEIMSNALTLLIKDLLARPSVYRVYATHDIENPASGRVMEKAGMKFEGIIRRCSIHPNISSEPRDSKQYSIVR